MNETMIRKLGICIMYYEDQTMSTNYTTISAKAARIITNIAQT